MHPKVFSIHYSTTSWEYKVSRLPALIPKLKKVRVRNVMFLQTSLRQDVRPDHDRKTVNLRVFQIEIAYSMGNKK